MLEKLKKTIDKSVATVSVKSNEFIEITKLKTQNAMLEKEIDLMKQQLGAAYFNQWNANQIESSSLEELCHEIQMKEAMIEANLQKIECMQREKQQILGMPAQNDTILCACGKVNAATAKFCISCGSKLELRSNHVDSESPEMKPCICGNSVKKTAKFCSKCGNKFEDTETVIQLDQEILEA